MAEMLVLTSSSTKFVIVFYIFRSSSQNFFQLKYRLRRFEALTGVNRNFQPTLEGFVVVNWMISLPFRKVLLGLGASGLACNRYRTLGRLLNCNSCGIHLQNNDSNEKGYYIEPKRAVDSAGPSLQDIKYLLFSQDIQQLNESEDILKRNEVKIKDKPIICKRCSDLLYQNHYNVSDFPRLSLTSLLDRIPRNSNLAVLAPLTEFPLHIDKKLLSAYNTTLVFTKCDQVIRSTHILDKELLTFFNQFFKLQLRKTLPVVAISSTKRWGIAKLFSLFKKETYLIGVANAGKSTLVNTLLQKFNGEKLRMNHSNQNSEPLKDEQNLAYQTAGVSHVPNMTRNVQHFKFGNKMVNDMPGYTEDVNEVYLEDIIQPNWLKTIRKTELFKTKKIRKKIYTSYQVKENRTCYTIGGFVNVVAPRNSITQIVKYIAGESNLFKNIDRMIETFSDCHKNEAHPLRKYCGITAEYCNKDNFIRHVIPPFQGSIEIVIQGVGYLTLRSTGRYEYTGLYEVWLPKGMKVCVREPLEKIIMSTFPENNKLVTDREIISSTYPMAFDEEDVLGKMREIYLRRTEHDLMKRKFEKEDPKDIVTVLHEEPPNLYWYYNW